MKPQVWMGTTAYREAHERLATWAEVITAPDHPESNWIEALLPADGAVVLAHHHFDAAVFSQARRLKIVARLGAGYDNIDLATATEAGVCVTNTPGASAQSVAEHTFALILGWLRKIREADQMVRSGRWNERRTLTGPELSELTLGIVGIGRVGCLVAQIARHGYQMRVLAYDPFLTEETVCARSAESVRSFEELLCQADIVSLHVPANADTFQMINATTLAWMKPNALLVNTARGAVLNERDLVDALQNGVIGGAALDVFESEPPPESSRLLSLPNVLLSPHVAGLSSAAVRRIGVQAAGQVYSVLHGERPEGLLNPQVWEKRRKEGER